MRLDAERLRWLEEICQQYEDAAGEEVASYLRGRGLDMEVARQFRMGLVVDPPPEHQSVAGRLALPVIKKAGVTGFQFRCIADHDCDSIPGHAKFITKGSQSLINVTAVDFPSTTLEVVEGNFDTYSLSTVFPCTIGIPGVKAWTKLRDVAVRLLSGFREVRIWPQNDAGKRENYGHQLAEAICNDIPQAYSLELPPETDVNLILRTQGKDALREYAGL